MKSVYVTGCLGLIGSHVTKKCLDKGWKVRGVDKVTYAANLGRLKEFEEYDNFEFIKLDINDLDYLPYCDYVINLSAWTHVCQSIEDSSNFIKSNILGVHNLLELIRSKNQYDKPILLHFSTDEVMGDCKENIVYDEECLLDPSNPYSGTKASADMLILAWERTYNVPYVIVRPSNNYGKGQYVEKLIPLACKNLNAGKKIPLHLKGTPVRVWLHADDTAEGIIKIIESGVKNEIFNISGDEEYKNIDVIREIVKIHTGKDFDIQDYVDCSYERPGVDLKYRIDDSKIRKMLGWIPKKKLFKELPGIVEYYKENFIW